MERTAREMTRIKKLKTNGRLKIMAHQQNKKVMWCVGE
jgi:hypothetical protein